MYDFGTKSGPKMPYRDAHVIITLADEHNQNGNTNVSLGHIF
jgi:hypothetical protein